MPQRFLCSEVCQGRRVTYILCLSFSGPWYCVLVANAFRVVVVIVSVVVGVLVVGCSGVIAVVDVCGSVLALLR